MLACRFLSFRQCVELLILFLNLMGLFVVHVLCVCVFVFCCWFVCRVVDCVVCLCVFICVCCVFSLLLAVFLFVLCVVRFNILFVVMVFVCRVCVCAVLAC